MVKCLTSGFMVFRGLLDAQRGTLQSVTCMHGLWQRSIQSIWNFDMDDEGGHSASNRFCFSHAASNRRSTKICI